MGDGQEQDHYVEQLREVFNSFDSSGSGSLSRDELSDLCLSLHLEDATPTLIQALLHNQDCLSARVDFEQFKNALILVLSSTIEQHEVEQEPPPKPASPEIQPKFVKGSKRYGRRSNPEFIESVSDLRESSPNPEQDLEENYDSAVPCKRERWNAHETSAGEEYEAEGQLHLWNPDEPSTPRGSTLPLLGRLEERIHEACEDLALSWDGFASHSELLALCEQLGIEVMGEVLQTLNDDEVMSVQEFVSRVINHNKPPTPSASTPYRQLKRMHSTQPFDEGGRRIATPSALTSTIGLRLFSSLDDGTGYTLVEHILDTWMEEGIENSAEILQALNFSLDGKLSLSDLTMALENELLVTKNGIHQAALASFKAEIRHLLARVDRELREKEKIQSDLEKAERLKTQLATEVDEHHSAIEQMNKLNLRKLEQDHKEKLSTVRSELMKEMDQIQQQAGHQREELEAEIEKIREDESFLRDHLSISVKENRRLEMELLDNAEKLVEAQNQISKLQTNLDNIMKEKFGDLDPGSAEFFLQEERIKQLHISYEAQCRELQDRIDELQSELRDFHSIGRVHQSCSKPLSEELESKSPGMESDPGIGAEEVQPFSMSLEAEMMLEQLKDRHLQEMDELRNQLETKISEFEKLVEKQKTSHEEQRAALAQQHQLELQALNEDMSSVQSHAEELQRQLEEAELDRSKLEQKRAEETVQEEEVQTLRQQLLEAHLKNADLDEQLGSLEEQQTEMNDSFNREMEELKRKHAEEITKLEQTQAEVFKGKMEEEKRRLLSEFEKEKDVLRQNYENEMRAKLEETQVRFEKERDEMVQKLTEQWQKERVQLDEQNTETLQVLLEEEMLKLVKEQEEKENKLRAQWEIEKTQTEQQQEDALLQRLHQQTVEFEQRERRLKEEWETEKLQLEEDYEGMVQERISEEKDKMEAQREEAEKRFEKLMEEERDRIQERHQETVKELTDRHREEREELSSTLDKLREDITLERSFIEKSFGQRLREVEERFTADQEAVAERFQDDVLRLEQHYQSELKAKCENHKKERCQWEKRLQNALENVEEQRQTMAAILEKERERMTEEWTNEMQEIENVHKEEVEALDVKNKQLQSELDEIVSRAQLREIDLSKQLNELHSRLQESLETREELVSQAQKQAVDTERMLKETVKDLEQERAELEAKYKEIVSISEKQIMERIELLTERDDMKLKIEEFEMLVKKMEVDFDDERKEMQQTICELGEKLKSGLQEGNGGEFLVERDLLRSKIKELEMEVSQVLTFVEKVELNGIEEEIRQIEVGNFSACEDIASEVAAEVSDSTQSSSSLGEDGTDGLGTPIEDIAINRNSENECNVSRSESCDVEEDNMASMDYLESQQIEHVQGEINGEQCRNVENNIDCEDHEVLCSTSIRVCLDPVLTPCPDLKPHCGDSVFENKPEAVCLHEMCENGENFSRLEEFEGANVAEDGNGCIKNKPQDVPDLEFGSVSHEDVCYHETVVEALELKDAVELGQWLEDGAGSNCPNASHKHQDITEFLIPEITLDPVYCTHDNVKDQDVIKLKALYSTASEENILLHEKISLLQQKIEILEMLLAHNNEKLKTGHQVLEENYSLKVKLLLFMEHIKELERKTVKMADLEIQYEDCMYENDKLKEQNAELERRVWSLESRMNVYDGLQDNQITLQDEINQMREENEKLSELLGDLDRSNSRFSTVRPESRASLSPLQEDMLDLNDQLKVQAVNDLEDCCVEFEKQNTKLRRAITELQDQSQTMTETTQAHRSEACRLSEENLVLKKRIDTLKEEDLKDLMQTMEKLKKEKIASQRAADDFKKQISELQSQSHLLEDKNGMLSVKNSQHLSDMEALRQQVAALVEDERKEKIPAQDKTQVETMDSLKLDLSSLAEEKRNLVKETQVLCNQLAKAQEKVKASDENLQAVTLQSSRLKADVRVLQQQKDSLQHEVSLLHKKLQNANDKNHVLERALHSTGLQSHSKKLLREELARLMEQDQKLLKQENEKLQAEVLTVKGDLRQAREKVRQLDGSIVSLKQQKQSQSLLLLNLEQENISLKQELEAQKEKTKGREAGGGLPDMESILQENEALKTQMARLSTQLIETFQAQLVGLLPPSPHRTPRGQHRGEEVENIQGALPDQRAAHADSYRRIGGL